MDKLKIIREYERFYLTKSSKGYCECVKKSDVIITNDGVFKKIKEYNYRGGVPTPKGKINKSFNEFGGLLQKHRTKRKKVLLWKHY